MLEHPQPKILVTGAAGQVGFELCRSLQGLGQVVAMDRRSLDMSDLDSLVRVIREINPGLIVNAAAYTAVDRAETDVAAAMLLNGRVPGVLAEEARRLGAALVHYSTDYVFDGVGDTPYSEGNTTNPINTYGETKLAGEQAIAQVGGKYLILRTSWVYGMRGKNFLRTMLKLAQERSELRVVGDQVGAPTWAVTIAALTANVATQVLTRRFDDAAWWSENAGIYHLTASGATTWADFAEAIFRLTLQADARPSVIHIGTDEYPTPAKRPRNSRLSNAKLGSVFSVYPPDWHDALQLCASSC